MRMTDDGGDTAPHKAVRIGCVDTVRLLVEQDPDFEFPANNAGESPLYLAAESGLATIVRKHCVLHGHSRGCRLRHCRLGRRNFEIKWKKMQKPEDETESKGMLKDIMEATQIHLVVATLLVTVTFAAGFTLPGGFESDLNSSNKGMAILIRETVFRAFVVSDTIAFTCSAGAVFNYFYIAISATTAKRLKLITVRFKIAILLQSLAMSAVVIAFVTGTFYYRPENHEKTQGCASDDLLYDKCCFEEAEKKQELRIISVLT
ncbi:hypothetical protein P3S67_031525 [Capsicum chacoense]